MTFNVLIFNDKFSTIIKNKNYNKSWHFYCDVNYYTKNKKKKAKNTGKLQIKKKQLQIKYMKFVMIKKQKSN